MCETCENEEPNLREIWAAADKKAKDWRFELGKVRNALGIDHHA